MAFSAHVGSFQVTGSTGNQAITGVGFQPGLIIFTGGNSTTAGSSANWTVSYGYAISSSDRACMFSGATAAATSATGVGYASDKCIVIANGTGSSRMQADFVSMDSDGFTINVTSTDGNTLYVNYEAWGGSDLSNVKGGTFQRPSSTGSDAHTGLGFQPDLVCIFAANHASAAPPALGTGNAFPVIGWATASAQAYTHIGMVGGTAAADAHQRQETNKIIYQVAYAGIANDCAATFTSFGADGFTISWSAIDSSALTRFFYFAIKGPSVKVGSFNTDTAATTGVGFVPKALYLQTWGRASSSSTEVDAHWSIGFTAGTSQNAYFLGVELHGADPTIPARRLSINKCLGLVTASGSSPTVNEEAALASFDADGFTMTYSTGGSTARQVIYVALGDAGAAETVTMDKWFNQTSRPVMQKIEVISY